jgi:glutaredoxin 3
MANVTIYTAAGCIFCVRAKKLLEEKDVAYTELKVDNNEQLRQEMQLKSGKTSVPQIFINDEAIGGSDDLYALDRSGQLDKLLNS